ncbi:MAG: PBSX family phage terminase large subunit [Eubacterium sp.]|nr:PBSX family phage terminase large subunit [Eubacterium sp.]
MKSKSKAFDWKPFSDKQLKIMTWWCNKSPVKDKNGIIADGAVRSGKTVSMAASFMLWAMSNFNECDFAICGKTVGSLRRNVLGTLKQQAISLGYDFQERRTDNLIVISNRDRTNYFYTFGGKDESSQDLIQGMTAAGVLFDEVALMPRSFVEQAIARCSVEGSKFWFNCNPGAPLHWFNVEWIKQTDKHNVIYLHFTMDDNLTLSEKMKERYRSLYSGIFFERYILGLWKSAEGLVYDMFDTERHVIDKPDEIEFTGNAYISCDYGTQNPTCFLMWRKYHNKWICVKEYYYDGRAKQKQKTDSEYADDMIAFIGDTPYTMVIVDPSAASFIAELRKRGIKVQKADNDVLDGIREVGKLLNLGSLLFTKNCENAIKEFGVYHWDEKAVERGEDKPAKITDHAMDAVRYFVYTILHRIVSGHK